MRLNIPAVVFSSLLVGFLPGTGASGSTRPTTQVACGAFTEANLPKPAPQTDPEAVQRFDLISREAKAASHAVVFLGDSLTQKWDRSVWERNFAPLDALNAGVNGDRTENLLWRIKHGNLDGQWPHLIVLLIGTNDIGRNRPARVIAEGVREILLKLRTALPESRILLLGVLPRNWSPESRRRRQVAEVNRLIRTCADQEHVFYADVGNFLLDGAGWLTRKVSTDGVHLTELGYILLTNRLKQEFGRLPLMK